jgi:hypothetical protein
MVEPPTQFHGCLDEYLPLPSRPSCQFIRERPGDSIRIDRELVSPAGTRTIVDEVFIERTFDPAEAPIAAGVPGRNTGSMSDSDAAAEGLDEQVHDLEHKNDVDQQVISDLVDQGVLDRAQIETLEIALTSCRRIGAAMGILMATLRVTEDDAFDRLREVSQRTHRKLRDVADDVMLTGSLPTR